MASIPQSIEPLFHLRNQSSLIPISRGVYSGRGFDAVVSSELTNPVVVQNRRIGRDVKCPVSWDELPDEVIPGLHDELRATDVLGALLVWVQLGSSPSLLHCDEACFCAGGRLHDGWIVAPLQVEERVLETVGTSTSGIQAIAQPSMDRNRYYNY